MLSCESRWSTWASAFGNCYERRRKKWGRCRDKGGVGWRRNCYGAQPRSWEKEAVDAENIGWADEDGNGDPNVVACRRDTIAVLGMKNSPALNATLSERRERGRSYSRSE